MLNEKEIKDSEMATYPAIRAVTNNELTVKYSKIEQLTVAEEGRFLATEIVLHTHSLLPKSKRYFR